MHERLDDFDRQILELVQTNNRLTHSQIGVRVNLSPSSVRRRLDSLRRSGIIKADVSIVDPGRTSVQVIVKVSFQEESLEAIESFKKRIMDSPEVAQCYAVSGDVDYILVVNAAGLPDYEEWGMRVLMSDPAIRRYDSHVVWSCVKYSTAVPI